MGERDERGTARHGGHRRAPLSLASGRAQKEEGHGRCAADAARRGGRREKGGPEEEMRKSVINWR